MRGARETRAEPRGERVGCADPAAIGTHQREADFPAPAPHDRP